MSVIATERVENNNLAAWGISGAEYSYNGSRVDFQDLMVVITAKRATVVEGEVNPMSVRMRWRNKRLEEAGQALGNLSEVQKKFASDAAGDAKADGISAETRRFLIGLGISGLTYTNYGIFIENSTLEKAIQYTKTYMDKLNNEASTDMTRLQSIVDRRDESFSIATSLMQKIGDTRSNLVRGL